MKKPVGYEAKSRENEEDPLNYEAVLRKKEEELLRLYIQFKYELMANE